MSRTLSRASMIHTDALADASMYMHLDVSHMLPHISTSCHAMSVYGTQVLMGRDQALQLLNRC